MLIRLARRKNGSAGASPPVKIDFEDRCSGVRLGCISALKAIR
jgi:hypothetical protein